MKADGAIWRGGLVASGGLADIEHVRRLILPENAAIAGATRAARSVTGGWTGAKR